MGLCEANFPGLRCIDEFLKLGIDVGGTSERASAAWRVATAEDVRQDREQARRFLRTPHPEIGGKTPLDAALTELGARQAEEVMARIVYGLPA
jgi:uncharacterized protein (DUF2384 family)